MSLCTAEHSRWQFLRDVHSNRISPGTWVGEPSGWMTERATHMREVPGSNLHFISSHFTLSAWPMEVGSVVCGWKKRGSSLTVFSVKWPEFLCNCSWLTWNSMKFFFAWFFCIESVSQILLQAKCAFGHVSRIGTRCVTLVNTHDEGCEWLLFSKLFLMSLSLSLICVWSVPMKCLEWLWLQLLASWSRNLHSHLVSYVHVHVALGNG